MHLPKGNTQLSQDDRTITAVWWVAESGGIRVGEAGVTSIEAYDESGHMACIPWIAVYEGTHLRMRIPADAVSIQY